MPVASYAALEELPMNRIFKTLLIGCAALSLRAGAFAQGGYWDHERIVREYRTAFYDRLQIDLDRAEHARYLTGGDFRRFDKARHEVAEFSAKWSRGIFDPRDMDGAIGSVQRVADIPTLHREDRDALFEDLAHMRSFRAHMEGRR
jgi:hypothetical protein